MWFYKDNEDRDYGYGYGDGVVMVLCSGAITCNTFALLCTDNTVIKLISVQI